MRKTILFLCCLVYMAGGYAVPGNDTIPVVKGTGTKIGDTAGVGTAGMPGKIGDTVGSGGKTAAFDASAATQ